MWCLAEYRPHLAAHDFCGAVSPRTHLSLGVVRAWFMLVDVVTQRGLGEDDLDIPVRIL